MGLFSGIKDVFLGSGPEIISPREVQQAPLWTPEQTKLFNEQLVPYLSGGATVNPLQQTSLQGLEQYAMDLVGGGGTAALSNKALGDILNTDPAALDNYFNTAVADPLTRYFNERIVPIINREYARSGFFGTDRERALGQTTEDLVTQIAQQRAKFAYDTRQQQIEAAGTAATTRNQGLQALAQIMQSSTQPEDRYIQLLLAALGLKPFENIAFQDVVSQGTSGILGPLIQAGGMIGAAALMPGAPAAAAAVP